MLIYILFITFLVMLTTAYFMYKKDILQPAVIFLAVYTVSIFCAMVNVKSWGIDLKLETFLIILLGGIEFIAISYIINKLYLKKNVNSFKDDIEANKNQKDIEQEEKIKKIKIQNWKLIAIIIYDIIVIMLLIKSIIDIANSFGQFSTFSQALSIYRANTSYNINASLPRIVALLLKPIFATAYIFLFVYIYNIIFTQGKIYKKLFKEAIYLIPVIIYIVQCLLQSNRLNIITVILAGFTMCLILWYEKNSWKKVIKIKNLVILAIVAILGLMMFYKSATLIGRKVSKNMFEYITMYCGGSIECLDLYIREPIEKTNIIGYETFSYFIRNLNDYHIIKLDKVPTPHLEWRYSNDIMVGNVYTAYRRWIYDFGYIGMVILQAIMAIFYNIYYNKIKYSKNKQSTYNIALILYGSFAYSLFTHPIDSTLYSFTCRLAFITQTITLIILYFFFIETNVELKHGLNIKIANKYLIKDWKLQKFNAKLEHKKLKESESDEEIDN